MAHGFSLRDTFQEYCLNCTIHGMRYIAEPGRHWIERVFWVAVCALSWWAAVYLIAASHQDLVGQSAVAIAIDPDWLRWSTTFPALSLCERAPSKNDLSEEFKKWKSQTFENNSATTVHPLFWQKVRYYTNSFSMGQKCMKIPCPVGNYTTIARSVVRSCEEIFLWCKWNDEPINCCDYFLQFDWEVGNCFTLNSEHGESPKLRMNASTGPGALELRVRTPVEAFLHSPQDVPGGHISSGDLRFAVGGKLLSYRGLVVTEVHNERGVRSATIEQRECRFKEENPLKHFRYYSFGGCIAECRKQRQMEICNCSNHMLPGVGDEACGYEGLECLEKKKSQHMTLKATWDNEKTGLSCPCLLGCDSMDLETVYKRDSVRSSDETAGVRIWLSQLPSQRLQRVLVRSQLDFVVDIGSALGLLMGASLLSLVEAVYYFVLVPVRELVVGRGEDCCSGRPLPPARPADSAAAADDLAALLSVRRTRTVRRGSAAAGPTVLQVPPPPPDWAAHRNADHFIF